MWSYRRNSYNIIVVNKGNNKITELRTILQRESKNSYVYKQTRRLSNNNDNCII